MDSPGHKKVFTAEHAEAAEMNIEEKLNKITELIIGVAVDVHFPDALRSPRSLR